MAPIVTTSTRKRPRGHLPLPTLRLALVLAALVVLVVAVCLLRNGRVPSHPSAQVPKTYDRGTSEARKPSKPPAKSSDKVVSFADQVEPRDDPSRGQPVTEAISSELSASQPSESSTTATVAVAEAPQPRHFRGQAEHLLSMVMSVKPGTEIPPVPLPSITDESTEEEVANAVALEEALRRDLAVAVTNDIVIYDTDSEKLAETKEAVADTKFQLAEIVKNGGSVTDAIREYTEHVNEGARLRSETIEKITPVVDSITNDAEAVEYVESVNEALKKEDIPPIKLEEVGFEVEEPQGP